MDEMTREQLLHIAMTDESCRLALAEWDSPETFTVLEKARNDDAFAAALWEVLWRAAPNLNSLLQVSQVHPLSPNPFLTPKDERQLQWPYRVAKVDLSAGTLLAAAIRVQRDPAWQDPQLLASRFYEGLEWHSESLDDDAWERASGRLLDPNSTTVDHAAQTLTRLLLRADPVTTKRVLSVLAAKTQAILHEEEGASEYVTVLDNFISPTIRALSRFPLSQQESVATHATRQAIELHRVLRSKGATKALRTVATRWGLRGFASLLLSQRPFARTLRRATVR